MLSAHRRGPRSLALSAAPLAVLAGLLQALPAAEAAEPARHHAVASESTAASREASKLLQAGGNAIDAAVVAALVAGMASPSSSGIGGGGFAMVWSARDRKAVVLDFREVAPAAVNPAVLDQRPLPEAQRGQSVGVPGEVAGLFWLHQRYGKTPWKGLVSRAATLAAQGFVAEPHTVGQLEEQKASPIARSASFKAAYLAGGSPPKVGAKLRATKLAATLRRIAEQGQRGYYEGPVAQDIVNAVNAAGGGMALADLTGYQPVEREPLRVSWEGKEVLTMPLPSAGGLLLAQTLRLFSKAELVGLGATPGKRTHLLAEAMRGAFADRARYLGDPALVPVDPSKLLAPERLKARRALMAEDRTHTLPRFGLEEQGTHHLITADGEGNWVTLTTTVNGPFGAKLMAEQSGVILNNELEDFTTSKTLAVFGMTQGPNSPRPGARPVSSMMPTLVLEGGVPVLALGGSGGTAIAPNVTQALLARLVDGAAPEQAVAAPRFSIPAPTSGQTLTLESALGSQRADLEQRGELLLVRDWKPAVQMIALENGSYLPAADPRKQGLALSQNAGAKPAAAQ
jgi:gamma-glutamyltranspeptidase/glutathione hydrolase